MNYYAKGGEAQGLKALAQELPKYGRMGDTMVAHINPQEAALLKSMGGSGTINPTTGLPEFGMFGIGGGGGFLGTGINKNASDPVSNALSNNPISKGVSNLVQGAGNVVDQGLVSLDKAVGKAIPGGWGTVGTVAASFIPGMTPLMMGGLGALSGSGVLRRGGSFNLQGAIMGGALAYGAANLASGLEAAGGGGADAVANAAGGTAPGAATAEGIASQIANQTGSAVSAAPGSQAAMLAEQVAGMGSAGAQNVASALTAPTTGTGIGSQIMAGNFGNAASQIGSKISDAAGNAYTSAGNLFDKATTPETYTNLAKGYGENVSAAGKGIANLAGLGEEGASKAAQAAFSGTGATMSNTVVPIAMGGMGLQAIEEQRNALEQQKAAGAISDADYQSQLAEINRQADVARASVAGSPFSTNPDRTYKTQDTLYGIPTASSTLYAKNPASSSATLYARGGAVDNEMGFDDSPRGLGAGNMTNGFMNGGSTPSFAQGGQARFLSGGGDGISDDIPANIEGQQEARLSDGEFVIPARIVSELGNGSSKAGAKQLYAMMDRVQNARSKTIGKGKFSHDAKAAEQLPV